MITVVLTFITFFPAARGHDARAFDRCQADLVAVSAAAPPGYARWVFEDALLKPTVQIETLLAELNEVPARDVIEDLKNAIGPIAHRPARMTDMMRLARQLTQLNLGYQGLELRCARMSQAITSHAAWIRKLIERNEGALAELEHYLRTHVDVHSIWVLEHLARVRARADHVHRHCLDNPPPPERGFWSTLSRVFWP